MSGGPFHEWNTKRSALRPRSTVRQFGFCGDLAIVDTWYFNLVLRSRQRVIGVPYALSRNAMHYLAISIRHQWRIYFRKNEAMQRSAHSRGQQNYFKIKN